MLVAGLMSGTSVDGIDVALAEISGAGFDLSVRQVAFLAHPYPPGVRQGVLAVSNAPTHTARLSQLNFLLGDLFADAVLAVCRNAGIDPGRLDLIGSHGQTIYHQAEPSTLYLRPVASTLQIGEPAVIAARLGAPVVADFRTADMAVGGQGAPLVPYVDYLLYRDPKLGRASLNIGGIANLTAFPADPSPQQVIAFDTGPGNMVIDALVAHFSNGAQRFDRDGRMAASGRIHEDLLDQWMQQPFLKLPPPKSCGREQYGSRFVSDLLNENLSAADLVATATAFTADVIARAIVDFVQPATPLDELIASGGGVKNPQILKRLQQRLPRVRIRPSSELGVDSDAKEALAFAIFAYETWHQRPSNLPSATGARRPVILGKLCWPPLDNA